MISTLDFATFLGIVGLVGLGYAFVAVFPCLFKVKRIKGVIKKQEKG